MAFMFPTASHGQFVAATRRPVLPPVTRAEAVSTLLSARIEDGTLAANNKTFADVPPFAWYADVMAAGERYGIVAPDEQGRLRPEDPITRSEFLKMTAFTFGLQQGMKQSYKDVPTDAWFAPYAGIAHAYQLFPMDADTSLLRPDKLVTRAEAAGIVSFFVKDRERTDAIRKEQELASDQAKDKLQLYLTMSTKRQNVKLVWPQAQPTVRTVAPKERPSLEDTRREILVLINNARAAQGLKPVKANSMLNDSAQAYAREMALGGFFSHVSPSGQTLRDRIAAVGYYGTLVQDPNCLCVRGMAVGENLGRGQVTAEQVMKDWLTSAGHRQTIMTPDFTDVGIGVASGYWVEHFGGIVELAAKP